MAFKPTNAQRDAIYKNGNILVSAAAGSGKTAVLVERVISKLCNRENPVRADELLIVTFTNAAAAEMRSRIEKRLDEEIKSNPQEAGLLLQKHLLANAKICTIDSFCIDLVRENFDKLDISPDFKIGDAAALNEINREVVYSIINRYIEEENQLFLELLDIVGAEFDEKNFAELVLSVYEYSRQLPFPNKWFDSILTDYTGGVFCENNKWYIYAFEKAQKTVCVMENLAQNGIELLKTNDDAEKAYLTAFCDAAKQISILKKKLLSGKWDEFYNALCEYKLMRLPTVRGLSGYAQITAAKDIYKYLGGKACEGIKKLFYADFSFIDSQFKKLYNPLTLFVDILKEFDEKVFMAYKENNIFTFHNTEHLALKLLCEDENTPTKYADEILSQYKEVLVDEYQDTNDLQNMLFYVLSDKEKKLFVVGDVKQSIYAFRGANPSNFLDKKKSYIPIEKAKEDEPQKIILGNNFRSKDEVCHFVNFFFTLFMQEHSGDIVYNSEEELIPTATFPPVSQDAVSVDIIDCTDSDEDTHILEARRIAEFIKNTIDSEPCIRQDDNTLRKANYGDFAILLRSVVNKAPLLVSELKKCGIPVNLNVTNFAESSEVSTFLALLRVIDNPQTDIELLTVLTSPIFSFTEDELAVIRAQKKSGNLYSTVIYAAKNGDVKCQAFLKSIEEYRLDAVTLPLPKLVSKLLISTEFLNLVSCMPDGEQRRSNLLLLSDYAQQYSADKMPTLSGFLRYFSNQMQNLGNSAKTGGNAVNIMSIHASKGLQFPVCILSSITSRFNDAEARSSAAYSTKFGLGFKYFDESDKQKYTTILREAVLDNLKYTALEEELRLFYVAMTRAQDKLHFVASFKNLEKSIEGYRNLLISSQNKIDYALFVRTKSYADWLMLSLLLHPSTKAKLDSSRTIIATDTNSSVRLNLVDALALQETVLETKAQKVSADASLVADLQRNFEYNYPFDALENLQSKVSVSVLANKAESEKYSFTAKPSFMSKDGISAAGRGTAVHRIMEFFDFEKYDNIESEIERLYEWQFISEEEKKALNLDDLKKFFASGIFERIKSAERVKREMRFMTEIPACEIDSSLPQICRDEKIIVQGAVDLCFVENGELVILDFKTDRVDDISELADAYGAQLSIYAVACEKIFGLKVKQKIIYSFAKSDILII